VGTAALGCPAEQRSAVLKFAFPVQTCGNSRHEFSAVSDFAARAHSGKSREQHVLAFFSFCRVTRNALRKIAQLHQYSGLTASLITRRFFSSSTRNSSQQKLRCRQGSKSRNFPPQGWNKVRKAESEWQVYRTRFLIRAKQLTGPLEFRDALGREHRGQRGDYLVESSDGTQRIAPREIFEDVYVAMDSAVEKWPLLTRRDFPISDLKRRASARAEMQA
jgi:hypothetical protein